MSIRLSLLNFSLKWFVRPTLNRLGSENPDKLRPWLDKPLVWGFRPARTAVLNAGKMSALEVPVLHIENGPSNNGRLLYLHGGAYIFGSAQTHARFAAHICGLCGSKGLSLNYRLAPEHPFPAALEDALAVYKEMLKDGGDDIVLAGDSAGGGLAFALLAKILAENLPKPVAIVAFSPWVDLTLSGESMLGNNKTEYLLPPQKIREARDFYAPTGHEDPFVSPVFADFTGSPRALVFVGNGEVLLDDAVGITKNLQASDVDATLHIYENTPHVWPMGHGRLPEADRAMAQVQEFLNQVLNN